MGWQFDGQRPIYAQLLEGLELRILSGMYPPGSRLASVRELAAEAGVNPNTMQRALAELERGGLVRTHRTNGRFVTDDEARIRQARESIAREKLERFLEEMRRLGVTREELRGYWKEKEGEQHA